MSMSSRSTCGLLSRSLTATTSMSFSSCLTSFLIVASVPGTTMVMRDTASLSAGPTARDCTLYPRRATMPVTLSSTPGVLPTVMLSTWGLMPVSYSCSTTGSRICTSQMFSLSSMEDEYTSGMASASSYPTWRARSSRISSASRSLWSRAFDLSLITVLSPQPPCVGVLFLFSPRVREILPVRATSRTPKADSARWRAIVLPVSPVIASVTESGVMSMTLPRNTSTSRMISRRTRESALPILISASSRSTRRV
mmetsp:Transcript_32943/g.104892  ORF Transcript_32943/g.104892 Transcript_32943/m.104892 type:complete len:253 (+) Transcript_32943:2579-3337(+)